MIRSHKIQLCTNNMQSAHLQQCCGVARFAYNWALARWNDHYIAGLKVSVGQLDKDYNKCKKLLFPWAYDVTKCAGQNAIKTNLKSAFSKFFKKTAKYPRFKKRGQHASFKVDNDKFAVFEKVVKLPLLGKVKMTERLRFKGKILSATISRDVDRWFIAITVEIPDVEVSKQGSIGIDLGIKTAIVTSDGQFFDAPKPLKRYTKKLKRAQQSLSRKAKGSKNRVKARIKVAKIHRRIRRIRSDWINKVTTTLSKNHVVCMEDLSVRGMMKNHCLAKAISDMGWYEIYRQLDYKTTVIKISRWAPSTRTCNACGLIKDMPLSERTFSCECGYVCDRDLNAAKNIHTAGLAGLQACGDESADYQDVFDSETIVREAGINHHSLTAVSKN